DRLNISLAQNSTPRFAIQNHPIRFPVKTLKNGSSRAGMARHLAKDRILPTLLSVVPIPWLHTTLGTPLVIPYYHMVSDEAVPHVKKLYRYRNIREFTRDLDFFLANY